jgi:hypothetical protein
MQIQKNPQLKKKQDNLGALKSELAKLISDRDILEHTVKPQSQLIFQSQWSRKFQTPNQKKLLTITSLDFNIFCPVA